jgi:hypothetical protein
MLQQRGREPVDSAGPIQDTPGAGRQSRATNTKGEINNMNSLKLAIAGAAVVALCGCSAMTTLSSVQPDVSISVQRNALGKAPAKADLATTTFGNYEFKAVRDSGPSMYGILPLKFNGGYLAVNILLFAPASFFNLREVYPLYEFDVDKGVVKYRGTEGDSWMETRPTSEETARAKRFYGEK